MKTILLLGLASYLSLVDRRVQRTPDVTSMISVPASKWIRCKGCEQYEGCHACGETEIEISAYRIDSDEVTQGQYGLCVKAKQCALPSVLPRLIHELDQPVTGVSWYDAQNYCHFVGKRLPTVAEWERAAFPPPQEKLGEPRISGDPCKKLLIGGYLNEKCHPFNINGPLDVTISEIAIGNTPYDLVEVTPDVFGYDFYGNVSEWTADWSGTLYNLEYLKPEVHKDPKGPPTGVKKIVLGGSYARKRGSRSGEILSHRPAERHEDVGFRCAADALPADSAK